MAEEQLQLEAQRSLIRVQTFRPESLVRREELGNTFAFDAAVDPAKKLISLFQKIPSEALDIFPDQQLTQIRQQSDGVFALFNQFLEFDPAQPDAAARKDQYLKSLNDQYQQTFSVLFPFISFSMARTVDFQSLEEKGRIAVQEIKDLGESLGTQFDELKTHAEQALAAAQEAAAEQGVTQQARYFAGEAERHETQAQRWLVASAVAALVVTLYAVATLFFPKIEFLQANTTSEAIQLTASKVLIFLVLSYLLFQCVRNFSAHEHNAVTNKHRQNALMTYRTLAEAGGSPEARDTVLQHAAAAIYAPNDSGYLKTEERGYGGNPVVGFSPKSAIDIVSSGGGHG